MPAVPSLRTWSAGELATAAMLNANLRDPDLFCATMPHCLVTNTANVSIPNTTWTAVTWNTEVVDSENMHSVLSNTSIINIVRSGLYDVRGCGHFASDVDGSRGVKIEKIAAGSGVRTIVVESGAASSWSAPEGGSDAMATVVHAGDPGVFLGAGDQLEMSVIHSAGASLNLLGAYPDMYSWLSVRWVAVS